MKAVLNLIDNLFCMYYNIVLIPFFDVVKLLSYYYYRESEKKMAMLPDECTFPGVKVQYIMYHIYL